MRITVGGVLVFGVGAALGYEALSSENLAWIRDKSKGATGEVSSLLKLFRSSEKEQTIDLQPNTDPTPAPIVTPTIVPPPTAEPVAPVAAVATPSPQTTPWSRTRRSRIRKRKTVDPRKTAVTKPRKAATPLAVATPRAPSVPGKSSVSAEAQRLVGSYVAVKLNTGRTVMGVLEQVTASNYKLELPGLGSFTYPLENVESIRRAE